MVLKNSKWDKKAKYQYMKKHGLNKRVEVEKPGKKWSKSDEIDEIDEIDEEWDSDVDNDLLNHVYPSIGDEILTRDQKIKIKLQILQELRRKLENGESLDEEEQYDQHDQQLQEDFDGIYLGSTEDKLKDVQNMESGSKDSDSSRFSLLKYLENLDNNPRNRRLLKNNMTNNFLEEYGFLSYKDITKPIGDENNTNDEDYYNVKRKNTSLKSLPNSELDGFKIGEDPDEGIKRKSDHIRLMTEQEFKQDLNRNQLNQEAQFLNQIKSKYGKKSSLQNHKYHNNSNNNIDDDIDVLLGFDKNSDQNAPSIPTQSDDIEDLIESLGKNQLETSSNPLNQLETSSNQSNQTSRSSKPFKPCLDSSHQDFLDSIL